MESAFTRLKIEGHREQDCTGTAVKTFEVLFNPNTYSQKCEIAYHSRQGAGDTGSPQIYSKIKPREYSFELLFDGTGTAIKKVNVHDAIDEFLAVTGGHDGKMHRPMYLLLRWGKLHSTCVLKSADITYSLFEPGGDALRAKVRAVFTENIADALRVRKDRRNSPDLTHVHTVSAGEHLSQLADRYYGDPSRYLQVAQYNRLANFRRLDPGQQLLFPPILDAAP